VGPHKTLLGFSAGPTGVPTAHMISSGFARKGCDSVAPWATAVRTPQDRRGESDRGDGFCQNSTFRRLHGLPAWGPPGPTLSESVDTWEKLLGSHGSSHGPHDFERFRPTRPAPFGMEFRRRLGDSVARRFGKRGIP